MKLHIAALALLASPPCAYAGAAESVQFAGFVRTDNGTPVRFDIQVPAAKRATLVLDDGSKVELAAPGATGSADAAARLVSASGSILHNARFADAGLASTTFAYLVCSGKVTYLSPVPARMPSCPEE